MAATPDIPLPLWLYPVLFCVGTIAGLVDSIAGGGGLITAKQCYDSFH